MKRLYTVRSRVLGAVFLFALILFFLVQFQYQYKIKGILESSEREKYETVMNTVLPIFAVNIAFELGEENRRFVADLVSGNPDLVSLKLFDTGDRELAGTQQRREYTQSRITVVKELVDPQSGVQLGRAEFIFANRALQMTETEHTAFLFRYILVAGVLLLLLLFILYRAFRPLNELLGWIRGFDPKTDTIETMPVSHCVETRMIEESMRQMFGRIRHYTGELDRLNRQLDEKVRRRTEDLSSANLQLKEEIRTREAAQAALKSANRRLTELSRIDMLTGIANRRYFEEHLHDRWSVCSREHIPITLVICDIDHFKQVNDTYGHPAGDVVIRTVAETLKAEVKRASDLVARYGGEEFAIILFDTKLEDALVLIKRIQEKIRSLPGFSHPAEAVSGITLSFGICSHVPLPEDRLERCVIAADRALYRAKDAGRDRIIFVSYDEGA